MRVALVNVTTTTKIGGVETFVWQLARSLAARDIAVTVFGGASADGPAYPDAPHLAVQMTPYIDRARFRRVPLLARQYGLTKLLERASHGIGARAALERGGFDLIHIQKPFDFPLAALLRARTNARVVYSSHGRDFFPGDRRFTSSVDVMTACSRYNAAEVRERYGRDARIIYNGIDIETFAPVTSTEGRAEVAVPVVLWVGRLERWKGTIDALRAVALTQHRVQLQIVGAGPEERRLRDAARSLGIAERVQFLGARPHEEMPQTYAGSDIVIGTSFANETFGMALAEASACARPVIATNFGGFPEVVRDGETGLLVPPRDPTALAAAIDDLIGDPARRRAMGDAGRAFVAEQFAWPVVTDRVIAAYSEALDAH